MAKLLIAAVAAGFLLGVISGELTYGSFADTKSAIGYVTADGDADHDWLADSYEALHSCLDAAIPDAGGDPDADSLTNFDEMQAETDPCSADTDDDACSDGREVGADPLAGGSRDPLNGWDFFDVPVPALTASDASGTRSGAVAITDVLAVLSYSGTLDNGGPTTSGLDYDTDLNGNGREDGSEYDRSPSTIPDELWHSGTPSGAVSITDALVALSQVGHSCA